MLVSLDVHTWMSATYICVSRSMMFKGACSKWVRGEQNVSHSKQRLANIVFMLIMNIQKTKHNSGEIFPPADFFIFIFIPYYLLCNDFRNMSGMDGDRYC